MKHGLIFRLIATICLLAPIVSYSFMWSMVYRDNVLIISNNDRPQLRLIHVTYEIYDFSVTEGQDPERKISKGMVSIFSMNGYQNFTTFVVGRHKSEMVARWFTERVPSNKNTKYRDPKELNFAFIGKLIMTLPSGKHGLQDVYTFEDIYP